MQRLQAVPKTVETRRTTSKLSLTYAHSYGMFARTMSKQNKLERFGCRMANEDMERLVFIGEHIGLPSSAVVRLAIGMIYDRVVDAIEGDDGDWGSFPFRCDVRNYARKVASGKIERRKPKRLSKVKGK
jgi:hypothetical protein